jgi:hypothetical protein
MKWFIHECKFYPLAPYGPESVGSQDVPWGVYGECEGRCSVPLKIFFDSWSFWFSHKSAIDFLPCVECRREPYTLSGVPKEVPCAADFRAFLECVL